MIEDTLKKNQKENNFLLNKSDFTYADARISPYIVRLYLAIQEDHQMLTGINLNLLPNIKKYAENLINHRTLAQAFNLDEPVNFAISEPKFE